MHNALKDKEFNITPYTAPFGGGGFVVRRGDEVVRKISGIILVKDAEFYTDKDSQEVFCHMSNPLHQAGWLLCSDYTIITNGEQQEKLKKEFSCKIFFTMSGGFRRVDTNDVVKNFDEVLLVPNHAMIRP